MSEETELRPCPFCGTKMHFSEIYEDAVNHPEPGMHDRPCPGYYATRGDNIDAETWNVRAELAQMREVQRWIAVEEDLPEPSRCVLVANGGRVYEAMMLAGQWYNNATGTAHLYGVTHWMPLPEPPEEK